MCCVQKDAPTRDGHPSRAPSLSHKTRKRQLAGDVVMGTRANVRTDQPTGRMKGLDGQVAGGVAGWIPNPG